MTAISASTIRTLVNTEIMAHASITAITDRAFDYDPLALTAKNINNLKYDQRINFFSFQVLRSIDLDATSLNGNVGYGYSVECLFNYILEANQPQESYNQVIDRIEILDNLIISELGTRWSNNFNIARQSNSQLPEEILIDNVRCFKASVLWTGTIYA
jgi:hypothetical protein